MPRPSAALAAVLIAGAGCTLVVDADPAAGCRLGDHTWSPGDVVDAGDGCNLCTCKPGGFTCTRAPCPPAQWTCTYGDRSLAPGERLLIDACNTCTCNPGGELACTDTACATPGCLVGDRLLAPGQSVELDDCKLTCGEDGQTTKECHPPGCTFDGVWHAVLESFPGDGEDTCTCTAPGVVECVPPSPLCTYDGHTYEPGEIFAMTDGCNRCKCTKTGALVCTDSTCESTITGTFPLPQVNVAFVVSNMADAAPLQKAIADHTADLLSASDGRGWLRVLGVTSTGTLAEPACTGPAHGAENGRFVPTDPQFQRLAFPALPGAATLGDLIGALQACQHLEQGIAAGARAVSPVLDGPDDPLTPAAGDGNLHFVEEGKVAVVFATSGDDHSPLDLETYAADLRAVRGERLQNELSFHLLVGPPGLPCESRNGIRYRQLVEDLGGTVEYACTGFTDHEPWVPLGRDAFHFDVRVLLDDLPADQDGDGLIAAGKEIRVFMNQENVLYEPVDLEGNVRWRYDPAAEAVDFDSDRLPPPGSTYWIRVHTSPPDP